MPDTAAWNEALRSYAPLVLCICAIYVSLLLGRIGNHVTLLLRQIELLRQDLRAGTQDAYGDAHLKQIVMQLISIMGSLDMIHRSKG